MGWDEAKIDVAGIVGDSITDGPGIRLTVFVQGCPHHCPGCQNPQTWPFSGGTAMTVEEILSKLNPMISGVTFSGGEPFCQAASLIPLAEQIAARGLELAIYTGYTAEELLAEKDAEQLRLFALADIVVDGRFEQGSKSYTLKFRGSANQRILDAKATVREGKAVLNPQERWNRAR